MIIASYEIEKQENLFECIMQLRLKYMKEYHTHKVVAAPVFANYKQMVKVIVNHPAIVGRCKYCGYPDNKITDKKCQICGRLINPSEEQ